ncbi:TetR/AcrR family transcriptional regulator [Salinibacterium hongtaonis]|uniref:TetR/AcrR family transcriptional regulator n=1 Tax=Homoserinimonas hongtaonis TaxID=2079791 RepID=UPI001304D6D0|nr:TetR/AcrR family transcriptional regulator [Salinibacterium hongtaonis]
MSRVVNRQEHESKRSAIVSAAAIQFATHGYQRSTTAEICRAANISSGTFFHYFPTKLDSLVAVLESGNDDLRTELGRIENSVSGLEAIRNYATVLASELGDESFPVFVAGIAGLESHPRVAAALLMEAELVANFLARNIEAGQANREIRKDATAQQLATWTSWLLDGASHAAATGHAPLGSNLHGGLHALLEPH